MASSKKPMTHRQWLNIMTVTTAFMILLFVIVGRIMEQKLTPAEPPERPFASIQALTVGDWQVTLSPDGWLQRPRLLTETELATMMHHWQQFEPTVWSNQVNHPEVFTVDVTVNQITQRWRLLLGELPLLHTEQQSSAIVLNKSEFNRLFPTNLLEHWKSSETD